MIGWSSLFVDLIWQDNDKFNNDFDINKLEFVI